MIEYIEGNIFESPAQVIVNTVNTVGVMGKGLALSFKQRYPEMFKQYRVACEKHLLTVGKLMLFYEEDHWILLFPTKEDWRNPSKPEYIEQGLQKFVQTYADKGITSIAFPRLGCGNGELDWGVVKPLMEHYLKKLPIDVYIYLGVNASQIPEHKEPQKTIQWLRENAKDMSFNGLRDDLISLSSIFDYPFAIDNQTYNVRYSENNFIFCDMSREKTWNVNEDMLYSMWDDIRNSSVFSECGATQEKRLVCGLLNSVGYLSKIKLFNEKLGQMEDGYQVNAGLGRILSFEVS